MNRLSFTVNFLNPQHSFLPIIYANALLGLDSRRSLKAALPKIQALALMVGKNLNLVGVDHLSMKNAQKDRMFNDRENQRLAKTRQVVQYFLRKQVNYTSFVRNWFF